MANRYKALQRHLNFTGFMALSFAGSMAQAQAPAADTEVRLEEIIVTAQRREQNLQQTPVAVTAFTTRDFEERDVRSVRDLVETTPNLHVIRPAGSRSNQILFSIRGFSMNGTPLGAQPPVGIYVDDVFYPALTGSLLRVTDLESLEVLRGPQGTLFGRNSLGGAVRYNSVKPNNDFAGHVDATLGQRDRREFSGAVNIPLTDILAMRVSGGSFKQDGYVKDSVTGKPVGNSDDTVGRVQVRFTPSDALTIDLSGEYAGSKIEGDEYVIDALATPIAGPNPFAVVPFVVNTAVGPIRVTNLTVPTFVALPAGYDSRYVKKCNYCASGTNVAGGEYGNTYVRDVRANVTWKVNDALTLKSLSSYFNIDSKGRGDADHSVFVTTDTLTLNSLESYSQEFQANGALMDGRLNYTAGLYYFDSDQDRAEITVPRELTPTFSNVKNKAYAAYAQGSYEFIPNWTATVGARYGRESVDIYVIPASFVPNVVGPTVRPPKQTYSSFTPQAKLQFQVTQDIMTYVSAAKGFRGGTINALNAASLPQIQPASLATSPIEPDSAWSYELGIRTQFFDNRLQINATAFDAEYKDIQVGYLIPPLGFGGPAPVTQNAGDAQIQGFELEMQAVLGNLRLSATAATLSAHYKSIINSTIGLTPEGGTVTFSNDARFTSFYSKHGSYIEHTPALTYSLGAGYTIPLPLGSLLANVEYAWQDEQVSGTRDIDSGRLKAYGLLDAGLAWEVNKSLTVSVTGKNVLDKFYTRDTINVLPAVGQLFSIPGEPRTVSASVRYKF